MSETVHFFTRPPQRRTVQNTEKGVPLFVLNEIQHNESYQEMILKNEEQSFQKSIIHVPQHSHGLFLLRRYARAHRP